MTLRMPVTGREGAGLFADTTTGMGDWGSSSRYLLGNLRIRLESAGADSDGSLVEPRGSAVNTGPGDVTDSKVGACVLEDAGDDVSPASGSEAGSAFTSNCGALEYERGSEG